MKSLRDKTHVVMIILVVSFVGLMVFEWGMDITGTGPRGQNIVGEVNGEQISYEEIKAEYDQLLEQERQQRGEIDEFTSRRLIRQVWDRRITFMLLQQEVVRNNITVSDAELIEAIRENPPDFIKQQDIFLTDGQFDHAKYLAALNNPNVQGWEILEVQFRALLPQQKLIERVTSSARVTDLEVRNAYIARNEKVKIKYLFFTPDDFASDSIAVSDDEIRTYYDDHKDDFHQDARSKLAYVKFDKKPSAVDEQRVAQQINDLYQQINDGADFETIARDFSEDGSASNGGDLGFFGRGTMVKEFEEVAFQTPIGKVSKPVKSIFGWHIIRVEEKKREKGEEQIRARHILLKSAIGQQTIQTLLQQAKSLLETAKEEGLDTAVRIVTNDSLDVQETAFFPRRDDGYIPQLGYLAGAASLAFDKDVGTFSEVLENDTGFFILHVAERKPAGIQSLDEATERIRSILSNDRRKEKARQQGQAMKVQLSGKTFDDLPSKDREGVKTPDPFARQGFIPGVGQDFAFIGAAFRLTMPGQLSDLVEGDRGFYLIQLVEQQPIEETLFESEKESLYQQLIAQKQNQLYTDWLTHLKDNADIEDRMNSFFVF